MVQAKGKNTRLSRNFHKTFIPERRYIHAMLQFASKDNSGDSKDIAKATGIPTGESSGKVPAILDYCRGMGLIVLADSSRSAVKAPRLTSFGRVVLLDDPFMKEAVTQWIAHLNLCGALNGADVWHQLFFVGYQALGNSFQRCQLENFLKGVYGGKGGNLIGPLVRMYEDPAAFAACGALKEEGVLIRRVHPPVIEEFSWGYAAWILDGIDKFFQKSSQVTVTELDRLFGWKTIPGWGIDESQGLLRLLESKGVLVIDRHMNPWILRPTMQSSNLWSRVYDDLI